MSLMKIYWVLFSSCLTTSCEASWILNSAGNTAHLLFLKVSTVWNGRIPLLKAAPRHAEWGLSPPPSALPRSARQRHPHIISKTEVVLRLLLPLPRVWTLLVKVVNGGPLVQVGHYYSDISSQGNPWLRNLENHFPSFPGTWSSSLF